MSQLMVQGRTSCCSSLLRVNYSAQRSLSLASFRFPWLSIFSKSDSAVSTTEKSPLPSSVKPWLGSDPSVYRVQYPDLPEVARIDLPITKHEQYMPPRAARRGEWTDEVELNALGNRLRFPKERIAELRVALTHVSYCEVVATRVADEMGECNGAKESQAKCIAEFRHNGQLACHGAAAAQLFVVEHIHRYFPNLPAQGINELTRHLLQDLRLASVVKHLGMVDMIHRSTLFPITEGDLAILADVFYAVVGALLTSADVEAAHSFVHDYVIAQLQEENLADAIVFEHPKLMLRSLLREQHKPAPVARVLNDAAVKTRYSVYHIAVYCGNTVIGKGFGRTPEAGEEEACRDALREFFLSQLAPKPEQEGKLFEHS